MGRIYPHTHKERESIMGDNLGKHGATWWDYQNSMLYNSNIGIQIICLIFATSFNCMTIFFLISLLIIPSIIFLICWRNYNMYPWHISVLPWISTFTTSYLTQVSYNNLGPLPLPHFVLQLCNFYLI